jgi:hypothetical protein
LCRFFKIQHCYLLDVSFFCNLRFKDSRNSIIFPTFFQIIFIKFQLEDILSRNDCFDFSWHDFVFQILYKYSILLKEVRICFLLLLLLNFLALFCYSTLKNSRFVTSSCNSVSSFVVLRHFCL